MPACNSHQFILCRCCLHSTSNLSAVIYPFHIILICAYIFPNIVLRIHRQVEGKDGIKKLMAKFRSAGPSTFYQGALASATATFVGHYPWFFVYNYLNAALPKYEETEKKLARQALIGFCSSAVSDTCSNSIRVIKVYKQANTEAITYPEALRRVLKEDGVMGLMGRGLKTKIMANGMQGLMFSVLWKLIDEKLFKKDAVEKKST